MAWDGSGTFARLHNWVTDAAAAIGIVATRHDAEDDNLAEGIQACLTKNNESKPTAHFLPNADDTYDLGSASAQWKDVYSGNAFIGKDAQLTGAVRVDEQASDPTNVANKGFYYCKDASGISEAYYIDSAGTTTQLTNNGEINYPASVWSTGDAKLTLKNSADTGWVLMNDGTIGNASSGGTTRANADTEDLFTLLWNNISDTWAPVSSGRGASAAADYAANKTITLPRALGRSLAVSGAGSGLTSRALGEYLGTETHTLVESEIPAHTHVTNVDSGGAAARTVGGSPNTAGWSGSAVSGSTGGDGAHNNMQPSTFFNVMIKL